MTLDARLEALLTKLGCERPDGLHLLPDGWNYMVSSRIYARVATDIARAAAAFTILHKLPGTKPTAAWPSVLATLTVGEFATTDSFIAAVVAAGEKA